MNRDTETHASKPILDLERMTFQTSLLPVKRLMSEVRKLNPQ
jgi:hypothetical protein